MNKYLPKYAEKYQTKYSEVDERVLDLTRMTEMLYGYNLLGALQRGKGKELIERAEEALRIQSFLWMHYSDVDLYKGAKLHLYYCFRELDDFVHTHRNEFLTRRSIIEDNRPRITEEWAKGVHLYNFE